MSRSENRRVPEIGELRRLLGHQQSLGELVDFAEMLTPDAVEPTLYLLSSLQINAANDPGGLRRWALVGALTTRYLFSIAKLPASRDWLI